MAYYGHKLVQAARSFCLIYRRRIQDAPESKYSPDGYVFGYFGMDALEVPYQLDHMHTGDNDL
jgi:hypothetical protein